MTRATGREVQRQLFSGTGSNPSYLEIWELQSHSDQYPFILGISCFASLTAHHLPPISSTCYQEAALGTGRGCSLDRQVRSTEEEDELFPETVTSEKQRPGGRMVITRARQVTEESSWISIHTP